MHGFTHLVKTRVESEFLHWVHLLVVSEHIRFPNCLPAHVGVRIKDSPCFVVLLAEH